jgi:outer membrane protein assembly factor BamA
VLLSLTVSACAGLKHLPDGESLYIGSTMKIRKADSLGKFKIEHSTRKLSNAYLTVWDTPNGGFMGTPFFRLGSTRLWLYNIFRTEKDHGFKHWMRDNFGEPPILVSDIQPALKCKKIEEAYANNGHFGTRAYFTTKTKRKGRKTRIKYRVVIAPSYHFKNILPDDSSSQISKDMCIHLSDNRIIEVGDEFNIEKLKQQRDDIWLSLQNLGYYYLTPEQIIFDVDSTLGDRMMNLYMYIDPSLSEFEKNKVIVDSIVVEMDSVQLSMAPDDYHYNDRGRYSYNFLNKLIRIRSHDYYSRKNSLFTSRLLSQSAIFARHSIYYKVDPDDSSTVRGFVDLYSKDATAFDANLDANYKTIGYVGPSIKLQLKQYNIRGKGANFNAAINSYYDFPIGLQSTRISNSFGLSWNSELSYLGSARHLKLDPEESFLPQYVWQQNLEYKNRLDLFEQVSVGGSYGIRWNKNKKIRHTINFINLTLFDLLSTTAWYDTIAANNNRIQTALNNQLIVSSSYSFTINKQQNPKWPTGYYFNVNIENAGNLLNLINNTSSASSNDDFNIFGASVAQFTNLNYEFKAFVPLGSKNTLAFRTLGGLGLAYGNSSVMPYSKQYYIGGATSMRPFGARTVGPGTYIEFDQGEVNQMGDLKFEANFEYRFKVSPFLSSALWTDYGNIWLLREDPNRPGSGINWPTFFNDMYLNAGVGLRFDLNFIIIRADLGAVLYMPILVEGKKWIWQNKFPLFAPSIGFGFPF